MTIAAVIEQRKYSTGSMTLANPPAQDSVRMSLVETSVSTDDDSVVLVAVDPVTSVAIPSLGDSHPTRTWLSCTNISTRVATDNEGRKWEVLCTYTLITAALPWDQPPVYSVTQNQQSIPVYQDVATGNLICNSAGVAYNPPVQADRADTVVNIAVNLLSFSYSTVAGYVDAVNSTSFLGFSEGFVRCMAIPYTSALYTSPVGTNTPYYQVTFQFGIKNPNGPSWQAKLLDQGTYQWVNPGSGNVLCPIILPDTGREATEAVPLDGAGHYAGVGATPVYNSFKVYYEANLNTLSSYW